jgi:hypothetical protein
LCKSFACFQYQPNLFFVAPDSASQYKKANISGMHFAFFHIKTLTIVLCRHHMIMNRDKLFPREQGNDQRTEPYETAGNFTADKL